MRIQQARPPLRRATTHRAQVHVSQRNIHTREGPRGSESVSCRSLVTVLCLFSISFLRLPRARGATRRCTSVHCPSGEVQCPTGVSS